MERLEWDGLFSMEVPAGWIVSEDEPFEILLDGHNAAIHISWFWPDAPLKDLEAEATEMVASFPDNRENLTAEGYTVFRDDSGVGVWSDLDPEDCQEHAWGVGCWAWSDAVMVMSWVGPPELEAYRDAALLMFSGIERAGHFANPST